MAFRKPATKKLGIKVLSLGKEGTGKTVFALSFPRIASIDGEAGQSFYENTEYGQNLVFVDNTQSYQELEEDIDYIEEEYEAQDIQTLVIDSETKVFNNLEETLMTIEEKKAKKKGVDANDSNLSIRSRGRIKYIAKRLQNLKIDLSSKGVNVVSIAQAKDVQVKQGDSWVVTGVIPDMVKGSAFDYDLVLEHYSEIDAQGNVKYKAKVVKDRTNVFKKGDIIGQVGGMPGEKGAGRSTAPHLHFEFIIRKPKLHNFLSAKWVTLGPAVAVDPAPFFPAMAGTSQWR